MYRLEFRGVGREVGSRSVFSFSVYSYNVYRVKEGLLRMVKIELKGICDTHSYKGRKRAGKYC